MGQSQLIEDKKLCEGTLAQPDIGTFANERHIETRCDQFIFTTSLDITLQGCRLRGTMTVNKTYSQHHNIVENHLLDD